jgi:hypothetical protein
MSLKDNKIIIENQNVDKRTNVWYNHNIEVQCNWP